MSVELTVVVPTYNEAENIPILANKLSSVLKGLSWELIFVDDDSPDDSYKVARKLAKSNPQIRVIQRIGRKGLASACIEGMLASSSDFIAVMDADLQHDENLLPEMLSTLKNSDCSLISASRYMEHASTGELSDKRVKISQLATRISNAMLRTQLTDPMSGFFMLSRELLDQVAHKLYGQGFKIFLDIYSSMPEGTQWQELPYTMKKRQHGDSKLDATVSLELILLLIYKVILGRILPYRFLAFSIVGLTGVFVNLFAMMIFHRLMDMQFLKAQVISTLIAMTSNYILNNMFTFKNLQLKGRQFLLGLVSFYITCSVGAVVGVAVSQLLFDLSIPWWLASFTGIVVSAFWNFGLTSIFTWGKLSRRS